MLRGDETIHQQTRLQIMATLHALPNGEPIEFMRLKAIVNATDGNLGAHLTTLESAGYIKLAKDFVGRKPRTRIFLTRSGRAAFARHVEFLRTILDASPQTHRQRENS